MQGFFPTNLLGSALIGVVFNAWIVGLICVQSYAYYNKFPKDRLALKLLVAWTLAIQVFNVFIQTAMLYHYLISSFGLFESLNGVDWEWSLYLGLISIAACSVQAFYAHRIFILSGRNYFVSGFILLLAIAGLALCLTAMIVTFALKSFQKLGSIKTLITAWLVLEGLCDLLIAGFQVYYLHRSRSGFKRMNRFITVILVYAISSCLLTSLLVIFELISFAVLGFNYAHVLLSYQMGAFHTLSFLMNLHARGYYKKTEVSDVTLNGPASGTGGQHFGFSTKSQRGDKPSTSISAMSGIQFAPELQSSEKSPTIPGQSYYSNRTASISLEDAI